MKKFEPAKPISDDELHMGKNERKISITLSLSIFALLLSWIPVGLALIIGVISVIMSINIYKKIDREKTSLTNKLFISIGIAAIAIIGNIIMMLITHN